MKKYEMLNQLQSEMMEARAIAEEICSEWNWTLSDKEATIVNNQIVINKGKVVEITKEDNSTIEMLRETIRQMNQNMNDMIKQHEEEITKLKEQYEQQMLDMTSEFEYDYECAINKREEQIKELEEKLDFKELLLSEFRDNMDEKIETIHKLENEIEGMRFGYENKIAKLKEEKTHVIYVENDPTYDNEPEPEKEVVNKVEEIIVPVTKEEKKQTTVTTESGLTFEIHKTHDAVKAKITEGQKVFYAVWSINDKAPAYSYVDKYNHYCRAKEWWKYDRLVKPELRALREELMNELKDKKNKNNTRKSAPQISKEVVKETPEEITIQTNDTVESTNDVSAFDDMEFC
ncbi:MAG: hypothetical protein IJ272_02715 [Clostridia bacterium]|nr:hypothetical protein [Clostridia bacterium]